MQEIETLYLKLGGKFITAPDEIQGKLNNIKAFIFDWDGVFNNGQKNSNGSSSFSEVDSMGVNLLRYSYFLKNKKMPLISIISGEKNESAFYFCKREYFHHSFFKIATKINALNFICEKENIKPNEVAYFFDDVLDLSIAEVCGIRILVNQKANPLFVNYCVKNNLADYITASKGGDHAVRESTELLMWLNGNYDKVIDDRRNSTEGYKTFVEKKKAGITKYFTAIDNKIEEIDALTLSEKLL